MSLMDGRGHQPKTYWRVNDMFASQLAGIKVPPTRWLMDSNRKLDGEGLSRRVVWYWSWLTFHPPLTQKMSDRCTPKPIRSP